MNKWKKERIKYPFLVGIVFILGGLFALYIDYTRINNNADLSEWSRYHIPVITGVCILFFGICFVFSGFYQKGRMKS